MLPHAHCDSGIFFIQKIHLLQIQRGVLLRQGDNDRPQLFSQGAGAVKDALLAGVDPCERIVHHIQQQRLLGGVDCVDRLFADVHHRSGLLHRKAQPVHAEQLHSDCAQSCAQFVVFVHHLPPAETRFSFPVSIVVRKSVRFKRFPALSTFLPIGHRFFRHIAHSQKL